ncbi:short-chain dehydrogenase [Mycolicibacterium duvalii]|uniref:Short-chain dehydrogenase n=1 Tax=Mycolicibacterium duvalii TaxID=39688 RepID=A0A7I7K5T7_9MYCO|nr:SDR family oxidoreductase [Mycolicibacterium duvalii]MCV7367551.1 SDR family oxidoreductase [Mycolicibacterium duvalii]PEG44126.1 short-chain dehydrogenase [Mycolicibacterium duvalii]BBX18859.1 short-chain dehydrogenase [Mycolicibacterium duvalii]
MTNYFRGKVSVVTGAASGIGQAIAEALLDHGAIVVLTDFDADRLAAVAEGLGMHDGRVHAAVVDVTDQHQVQVTVEHAAEEHGSLDFLFNNAGVGATMPIGAATLEHWRRIVDLNLWGVIYGVHAAVPIMARQGSGHIVNTASLAGLVPFPYQSLYCTTKYGVVGLSESLRYELAADGIRVSVVCPGNVISRIFGTPVIGQPFEAEPPEDSIPAEEAARLILAGVAAGDGIIAFPEKPRDLWRLYASDPDRAERYLQEVARQRRAAFAAGDAGAVFRATQTAGGS